jgi:hypothetical protein
MDDMDRVGKPLDATIVALHASAIARAARAEDDDVRMGIRSRRSWRPWWPAGWPKRIDA